MKLNNKIKLSLYKDEKIIIENYNELKDISENTIFVDIYKIGGQFLKIKRMDNYMIEISGSISGIKIERWENIELLWVKMIFQN